MKEKIQGLMHPLRIRMIQLMAYETSMTMGALAEKMQDVPRSTIYRHGAALQEMGVFRVVGERRVRGTVEREYAFCQEAMEGEAEEMAAAMLLKLYADFSIYFREEQRNVEADKLFLSTNTLLLSDEEMGAFQKDLFAVVQKYINQPQTEERKMRQITVVSSPCQEERRKGDE